MVSSSRLKFVGPATMTVALVNQMKRSVSQTRHGPADRKIRSMKLKKRVTCVRVGTEIQARITTNHVNRLMNNQRLSESVRVGESTSGRVTVTNGIHQHNEILRLRTG